MNKFAILLSFICFVSIAQDWPQYRGQNRDGVSIETNFIREWPAGLKRLWKTNVGIGSSSIVISGQKLFTMGHLGGNDTVYCLNAETGAELWKYSYPCDTFDNMHEGGPASTPATDGAMVYTLSRAGLLNCLDATTGKPVWSADFEKLHATLPMFGHSNSPLLTDKAVILSAGGPGMSRIAFDKKNGTILWKSGDEDASYASPVPLQLGGKSAIVFFNASGLFIADSADGSELGHHDWVTPSPINSRINAATPLVASDGIFITSGYGKGCARLTAPGGKPTLVWQNENMRSQYGTLVMTGGFIYGFDSSPDGSDRQGSLKCLDFKTGEEKWSRDDPQLGSLILAGGDLLMLTRRGELILAKASSEKYSELARMQVLSGTCRSEPVLVNGLIYVRGVNGEVACFDARKP